MLRGLDSRGRADDATTIIKVADRDPIESAVTVYVDANASADAADRQEDVTEEIERLEAAGVLADAEVVAWQDADAGAIYREFVDAVGADALAPFFGELAGGNALDVPHVAMALRDDGDLTGLYPRQADGEATTVEDCLRALRTGDAVENVETEAATAVVTLDAEDEEAAEAQSDEGAGEKLEQSGTAAGAD